MLRFLSGQRGEKLEASSELAPRRGWRGKEVTNDKEWRRAVFA